MVHPERIGRAPASNRRSGNADIRANRLDAPTVHLGSKGVDLVLSGEAAAHPPLKLVRDAGSFWGHGQLQSLSDASTRVNRVRARGPPGSGRRRSGRRCAQAAGLLLVLRLLQVEQASLAAQRLSKNSERDLAIGRKDGRHS